MNDLVLLTWLPFLAFGWIALAIGTSIFLRKRRGKPLFPKAPPGTLYSERGCSGRSLDTPWGRIGGARNCLLVALTRETFLITPIFPFNLMFLPEIYGLDHTMTISAIREVSDKKGVLGRRITVTYADPKVRRVELRLRNHDAFLGRLRQLGVSVNIA